MLPDTLRTPSVSKIGQILIPHQGPRVVPPAIRIRATEDGIPEVGWGQV